MIQKLTFLMILFCSLLNAKIIQIQLLKDIAPILEQQNEHSLVIFDIDYVTLIPKDKILRFCGVSLRKKLFSNVLTDLNEEALYNQMLVQADEELIEAVAASLIKSLQERGVPVIALTSRWTESGGIPWKTLRAKTLKEHGIDFSHAFANNCFDLDELHLNGPSPVYANGILFTNRYSKGETLKAFLNYLKIQPSQIVFIDDQKANLLSAESELSNCPINFLGVQDLFVQNLAENCSPEIAEVQVDHLRKTGKWLSDKEVSSMNLQLQKKLIETSTLDQEARLK